jgi:tight adherence protein C
VLPERPPRHGRLRRTGALIASRPGITSAVRVARALGRRHRRRRDDDARTRDVAIAVDLVGVGVNAGCPPYQAVELAAMWSPPRVAPELHAIVHACALGQSFDDALRAGGLRTPALRGLTDTLRTSARLGSPAAPSLVRLASEVRADVRRRAEARARTVPVRLCFPLVCCILPAFGLLTVVPVVVDGLHR